MDNDFTSIPGWERCAVSRDGQVRSPYGLLSCDNRARYTLRKAAGSSSSTKFPVGILMRMAGFFDQPGAQDAIDELRGERDTQEQQVGGLRAAMEQLSDRHRAECERLNAELAKAKADLALCRKTNGHLISLTKTYEARLDGRADD